MKKTKKRVLSWICVTICLCMLVGLLPVTVQAKKYYSIKSLGLDYGRAYAPGLNKKNDFAGKGKNGYQHVKIVSVSGNKVKYKLGEMKLPSGNRPVSWFIASGKTKTARITSSTKYYTIYSSENNPSKVYTLESKYGYHSSKFKNAKILAKTFDKLRKKDVAFMKIKGGKVTKVIYDFDMSNFS